jgi:hypothetical protein
MRKSIKGGLHKMSLHADSVSDIVHKNETFDEVIAKSKIRSWIKDFRERQGKVWKRPDVQKPPVF